MQVFSPNGKNCSKVTSTYYTKQIEDSKEKQWTIFLSSVPTKGLLIRSRVPDRFPGLKTDCNIMKMGTAKLNKKQLLRVDYFLNFDNYAIERDGSIVRCRITTLQ